MQLRNDNEVKVCGPPRLTADEPTKYMDVDAGEHPMDLEDDQIQCNFGDKSGDIKDVQ